MFQKKEGSKITKLLDKIKEAGVNFNVLRVPVDPEGDLSLFEASIHYKNITVLDYLLSINTTDSEICTLMRHDAFKSHRPAIQVNTSALLNEIEMKPLNLCKGDLKLIKKLWKQGCKSTWDFVHVGPLLNLLATQCHSKKSQDAITFIKNDAMIKRYFNSLTQQEFDQKYTTSVFVHQLEKFIVHTVQTSGSSS